MRRVRACRAADGVVDLARANTGCFSIGCTFTTTLSTLQGSLLKKIVEAMKDLVTDANLECSSTGISMQVRSCAVSQYSAAADCVGVHGPV